MNRFGLWTVGCVLCALGSALVTHGARHAVEDEPASRVRMGETNDHADVANTPRPHRLPTLDRLVRHFDFEEAALAPYEMPLNFYRYGGTEAGIPGAAAQGFPPFGAMRLTNEVAYSGDWSFEFSLDGGSLAARVPTAVIPAVPYADYLVTVRVRTDGLTHARAGLAAWLHNTRGEIVQESHIASPLIRAEDEWETLSVVVRGEHEDASDLVIELRLLQPRQFDHEPVPRPSGSGVPARRAGIPLEDARGRAWFDDVIIMHRPRIEMNMDCPGNIAVTPAPVRLKMLVRDVADERLTAQLEVFDIDGRRVFERRFAAPRLPRPRTVEIPLDTAGWYRARLRVWSEPVGHDDARPRHARPVAERSIGLTVAAQPTHAAVGPHSPLAVAFPPDWMRHVDAVPHMARELGVGMVILPIWPRGGERRAAAGVTGQSPAEQYERYRPALERLLRDGREIMFALERVPDSLAAVIDVAPDDVQAALSRDVNIWREYLHDVLVNFGLEVPKWQLGTTAGLQTAADDHSALLRARSALAAFVPEPMLFVPASADWAPGVGMGRDGAMHGWIPHEVRPESIAEYAARWPSDSNRLMVSIEPLPVGVYGARASADDLALRALHAWRAGIQRIVIAAPWSADSALDGPQPAFAVWRHLSIRLAGRRVAGELSLGEGVRCWILQGGAAGDAALVAWREQGAGDAPLRFRLPLASSEEVEILAFDIFGNMRRVSPVDGEHLLEIGASPVFIEGVHAELVQFRSGLTLDPPFVASEHRVQEHALVLRNPWSMPITGTLHLRQASDGPDSQWRISPRAHEFAIRPHGEVRLPVEIVLERGAIAGPRRIEADVTVQADTPFRLNVAADAEVGLSHIDATATWRFARNVHSGEEDIVITQYITNKGDRPLNLDVFLLAPNVPQQRRLVAGLEPGELAIRTFRIADGANRLTGKRVRLSVAERGGIARLNHALDIPDFVQPSSIESQTTEVRATVP